MLISFLDPEGPSVSVVCDCRGTMSLPATADFASCEAHLSWPDRSRVQHGGNNRQTSACFYDELVSASIEAA